MSIMDKALGYLLPAKEKKRIEARRKSTEFISMLNDKKRAKKELPRIVEQGYGLRKGEAKFLAISGEFAPTEWEDGYPLNPTVFLRAWFAPGNEEKHSGIYASEHKGQEFAQISIKSGPRANVTISLVDENGDVIEMAIGNARKKTRMVGFVNETFNVKFDITKDLGGDRDVYEAIQLLEDGCGRRTDLVVIIQEKGEKYKDGKRKFDVQRAYAVALVQIPTKQTAGNKPGGNAAINCFAVEKPVTRPSLSPSESVTDVFEEATAESLMG